VIVSIWGYRIPEACRHAMSLVDGTQGVMRVRIVDGVVVVQIGRDSRPAT
jgi:hypothetical protein